MMTKHVYLPTILISDKGSAFMSHVNKEVAGVLVITLEHATTKPAHTIGVLEWSHASIKQAMKLQTGEGRSFWHKYFSIAVLNYNVSYHAGIGCEPSGVFHERISYNVPGLKTGIRLPENCPLQIHNLLKMFLKNRIDFPNCPQKCHASLYQIQSVIW